MPTQRSRHPVDLQKELASQDVYHLLFRARERSAWRWILSSSDWISYVHASLVAAIVWTTVIVLAREKTEAIWSRTRQVIEASRSDATRLGREGLELLIGSLDRPGDAQSASKLDVLRRKRTDQELATLSGVAKASHLVFGDYSLSQRIGKLQETLFVLRWAQYGDRIVQEIIAQQGETSTIVEVFKGAALEPFLRWLKERFPNAFREIRFSKVEKAVSMALIETGHHFFLLKPVRSVDERDTEAVIKAFRGLGCLPARLRAMEGGVPLQERKRIAMAYQVALRDYLPEAALATPFLLLADRERWPQGAASLAVGLASIDAGIVDFTELLASHFPAEVREEARAQLKQRIDLFDFGDFAAVVAFMSRYASSVDPAITAKSGLTKAVNDASRLWTGIHEVASAGRPEELNRVLLARSIAGYLQEAVGLWLRSKREGISVPRSFFLSQGQEPCQYAQTLDRLMKVYEEFEQRAVRNPAPPAE